MQIETICMKCQILYFGTNKKKKQKNINKQNFVVWWICSESVKC